MTPADGDFDDDWPPKPRANPDLIGHEEAELLLHEALQSGRLAHGWLISGPRGIGKATLAYRFARFVLAGGRGGAGQGGLFGGELAEAGGANLYLDPLDPVFRRVESAGHADFLSVEKSLNDKGKLRTEIVVDDVREIGSFLSLTAAEGGWRVVVIDAADEMNPSAANAVLKVLEEPPSQTLMLLVSHAPGGLLATIRSRCRKLQLKPLGEENVVALLAQYRPHLEPADIAELARLSEGSIGRALALAEEGGLDLYRDLLDLLDTLPELDVPALHGFADRVTRTRGGETFLTVSELLRWWLGRLVAAAARSAPAGREGDAGGREAALIARLAGGAGIGRWLEARDKVDHLLARTDAVYLDRKQVVLNAFLAIENVVRP